MGCGGSSPKEQTQSGHPIEADKDAATAYIVARVTQLEAENAALKAENAHKDAATAEIVARVTQLEAENAALKAENAHKDAATAEIVARVTQLEAENAALKAENAHKDAATAEIVARVTQLEAENAALKAENAHKDAATAEIVARVTQLEAENAALKAENAHKDAATAEIVARVTQLEAENAALKAENAALRASHSPRAAASTGTSLATLLDSLSPAAKQALMQLPPAVLLGELEQLLMVLVAGGPTSMLQSQGTDQRQNGQLDFRGRCVKNQKFFLASFPGIYEDEWKRATELMLRMSVSCVFFPRTSDLFGKHMAPCQCAVLYGGHRDFASWEDGKAPWGCFWFGAWQTITQECKEKGQKAAVVYKRGHVGDRSSEGLGNSQQGEVRWLVQAGIPFAEFDIDQLETLSACAHEGHDGTSEYWREWHAGAFVKLKRTGRLARLATTADGKVTSLQIELPWYKEAGGIGTSKTAIEELTLLRSADASLREQFDREVQAARAEAERTASAAADLESRRREARVRQGTRPPMSNETLKAAVAEFEAESADFKSPIAEDKWGCVADWDVSEVITMLNLFDGASQFNEDLSCWDVSKVRYMASMFKGAATFTSDLSRWDVSNVFDMTDMFDGAATFTSDLSGWDVSEVTSMTFMFKGAATFTSDLSRWDVSKVSGMSHMFDGAATFTSDLSRWDVSKVTFMGSMFDGAATFTSDLSRWDISRVISMGSMFRGAATFTSDLSRWDVSKVSDMGSMFNDAAKFTSDLSDWDVSRATSMGSMFRGAATFTSDLSDWDVSKVTTMQSMFDGAATFTSDLSRWDVSKVTSMSSMFKGAATFTSDLSGWDVSKVIAMYGMFDGAAAFANDPCSLQPRSQSIPSS